VQKLCNSLKRDKHQGSEIFKRLQWTAMSVQHSLAERLGFAAVRCGRANQFWKSLKGIEPMNLYAANKQWSERPDDERYWNLDELFDATQHHAEGALNGTVQMNRLDIVTQGEELLLRGQTGTTAQLNNWSFGQLCGRVGAPAGYLRGLSPEMAAANLSYGLKRIGDDRASCNALFHRGDSGLLCRSFNSEQYSRIWNYEVVGRLRDALGDGWQVPPARPARQGQAGSRLATQTDVLTHSSQGSLGIKVGDLIAPAGLYASDHDMFAFLVNEQYRIDDGSEGGMSRGFFVSNSEVGAAAFKITKFLYRYVCGNHIVWDASDVEELRIVHRGSANERYGDTMRVELRKYANESAAGDEHRIKVAKQTLLGATKDQVLDKLFGLRLLPKATLEAAYVAAEREADLRKDVSPRSVWGITQGITAMSQHSTFADRRVELDRAAGKILSIAF
jgi:hypothetical protein